jgi:cytochrome c-type biogenesis protein CcmH/NrfG
MVSFTLDASRKAGVLRTVSRLATVAVLASCPIALEASQEFPETLEALEARAANTPNDARIRHALGRALAEDRQYARAIAELTAAIGLEPSALAPYLDLAAVFDDTNLVDEAEDLLRQTAAGFPESVDARVALGERLFRSGKLDAALDQFREAGVLMSHPGTDAGRFPLSLRVRVHRRVGDMHVHRLEFDQGLAAYEDALALDPGDADVHMALGLLYLRRNRLDEAAAAYSHVAGLDPSNPAAHHGIAEALFRMARFDDAAVAARRAVGLDPDHLGASYVLAMALVRGRTARTREAEAALDRYRELEHRARAADQREREIGGIYKEAIALSLTDDPAGAVSALEAGIARFPDARELYLNLGSILMSQGRDGDALGVFREMAERGWGEDPVVRRALDGAVIPDDTP